MPQKQFITSLEEFDPDRLTFSQVKEQNYGSKFIYINYNNGVDQGPLYLHMQDYFCFGVDGSYAPNDKQKTTITGYQIPIPLWGVSTKSEHQAMFYDVLNSIAARCADYLCKPETRKVLKKFDWTKESVLPKFMPLWFKRDEELNIIESIAPVLYAKLRTKGDSPNFTITTKFQDSEGEALDPLTLVGKKFPIDAKIKIESIFIGAAPKLQLKLEEVMVHVQNESNAPSIFRGPPMKRRKMEDDEQEDAGEEEGEEEEQEEMLAPFDDMPLFVPPAADSYSPPPGASIPLSPVAPVKTRKRKQL